MMKSCKLILLSFLLYSASFSQKENYSVSNIPEEIKKNAHAVKRDENILYEISDIDKASYKVHQVITILDEDGKDELIFQQYTSKYVSLDDAEIKVYDSYGKQIARYKKKDMNTVATGEGLIDDGFLTYFRVSAPSLPVTVEYNFELKLKGTLSISPYRILTPEEGVEKSVFTVKVPSNLDIRYKEKNTQLPPQITEAGGAKMYTWRVNNLIPIEYEPGAVSYESRYPSIRFAPNKFSYYGYEGDMSSWNSFGMWLRDLYKGLDELPDDRKAFFKNLVQDAPDKVEKIRRVYKYLQGNFRYVSIQLGIGGLKPFSAIFTDQKKYGDCKALSNYMKAALKAVDINSYVAIINSQYNREPVDPAFPSNDFDHVILCVPMEKDTIWLECTSSAADFGILGNFTENRNALLVTENGGVLVPTPKSYSYNNRFSATTRVDLEADGSGKTYSYFNTKGEYREEMDAMLKDKKDDQKEYIVYRLGSRQPDDFLFTKKSMDSTLTASLEMIIEKIPEFIAGSKMFLKTRFYTTWKAQLPKSENRKLDFYFPIPFVKYDTTVIHLPEGYSVETLPAPKKLDCSYASYGTQYRYDEKSREIFSIVALELKEYHIPAASYASVKKFFDDIMMDETQRIVVKKN